MYLYLFQLSFVYWLGNTWWSMSYNLVDRGKIFFIMCVWNSLSGYFLTSINHLFRTLQLNTSMYVSYNGKKIHNEAHFRKGVCNLKAIPSQVIRSSEFRRLGIEHLRGSRYGHGQSQWLLRLGVWCYLPRHWVHLGLEFAILWESPVCPGLGNNLMGKENWLS